MRRGVVRDHFAVYFSALDPLSHVVATGSAAATG